MYQPFFLSDHFCEPVASTSVRREDNTSNGGVHPIESPNVSTDNEGNDYFSNDRCIESRCRDVNMKIGKEHHLDTYQDYELLEASLRSKLVERLGVRASRKVKDTNKSELCTDKRAVSAGDDAEPSSPISSEVLSVLSSDVHIVFKHANLLFCGCPTVLFNVEESAYVMSKHKFIADRESDTEGVMDIMRSIPTGYNVLCGSSMEIQPFWPLCMYELRGRCNDDECPWQHIKRGMFFTLSIFRHSLAIPIYHIGSYLIKADSHLSHSVLARSICQYRQRGFCASFSLPFSVQRILPPDAPCLQPGNGPVADCHSSNRLYLYNKSQNGKMSCKENIEQGPVDIEQFLEMALDYFEGKFCEPDRKKALSLLARAIEAYPSAVVLWVVYLHIYYRKERVIGKDDMFLLAVQHNKGSYELWLMYINSRMLSNDRLNAYDKALSILCQVKDYDEMTDFSASVLDIFLQMIDFLCMSGQVVQAVSTICELLCPTGFKKSGGSSLPDIRSNLTVPDRCLLWTCCVYFLVYEKLPDAIVKEFELVKDLTLGFDWPPGQVIYERKDLALEFMESAMNEVILLLDGSLEEKHQSYCRSLHVLAVNHLKCVAALEGFLSFSELLEKYLRLYPSCIDFVLLAIRSRRSSMDDFYFQAFERTLNTWLEEYDGGQCLWNQYAEYALSNGRADLTEKLMGRWYEDFFKFRDLHSFLSEKGSINAATRDDTFGILNLCLYLVLQKNMEDARTAIDKALDIASPEDYKHVTKEHAAFVFSSDIESLKHFPITLHRHLSCYLSDHRSSLDLQPLSRRFTRTIKKPRILQMVNNTLGPVSRDTSLLNSVLETCYGPSLLPEKFNDIKFVIDFVDSLMEVFPANYGLALSLCRIISQHFSSLKFWACSLLVNSIFQAVPVAPEYIWLEAANVLSDFEIVDFSLRFHKQALLVYPFSLKLWKSYANIRLNSSHASEIVEAARERGIELNGKLH
ncbi:hypothetical protein AXF42_Ash017715 [Apostasia shenzhenica]|uniref:Putative zinc-finger domain-containing protein n=1 Tax=Apostasia shenzhenica TaxID=1088818 RepID=A0A2I0B624_9ASPA|nr:hypothetical protein AXF42_Ash017715 [Apostasia shenzhenica]